MTEPRYDEQILSDLYKDAYGFRPSMLWFKNWSLLTVDEKNSVWDQMCSEVECWLAKEKAQDEITKQKFWRDITALLQSGASDLKTALRWYVDTLRLVEGETEFYGASYICHTAGLPYSMGQVFVDNLGIQHG